jgi:uncharacterized protein YkwD
MTATPPTTEHHRPQHHGSLLLTVSALTLTLFLASVLFSPGHGTEPAARPDLAAELTALIGERRGDLDLAALDRDPSLDRLAWDWASHMAATGDLAHRDRLGETAWDRGARFSTVGENVGVDASPAGLLDAFVTSARHRENLDEPTWTRIGVGAHQDDNGRLWVAVNFSDGPSR